MYETSTIINTARKFDHKQVDRLEIVPAETVTSRESDKTQVENSVLRKTKTIHPRGMLQHIPVQTPKS